MCPRPLILFLSMFLLCQSAFASPYSKSWLSKEFFGHRWGIWSVHDTPSAHPSTPAFQEYRYFSTGNPNEKQQRLYTYWMLSLGPFGTIALSTELACLLIALILALILIKWRKHKKTKQANPETS